jgi:hypothetical protein
MILIKIRQGYKSSNKKMSNFFFVSDVFSKFIVSFWQTIYISRCIVFQLGLRLTIFIDVLKFISFMKQKLVLLMIKRIRMRGGKNNQSA